MVRIRAFALAALSLFATSVFAWEAWDCSVKVNGTTVIAAKATTQADCWKQLGWTGTCDGCKAFLQPGMNTVEPVASGKKSVAGGVAFMFGSTNPFQCPGPTQKCTKTAVVKGMHYPNMTCSQTRSQFIASLLTSYHFKSQCRAKEPLKAVYGISCQDTPGIQQRCGVAGNRLLRTVMRL